MSRSLLILFFVATTACATRVPEDAGTTDVIRYDVQWQFDPRIPHAGEGSMQPSCEPGVVIDLNEFAFRDRNQLRMRIDTRFRRNDLHPDCVDRDSSEAVIRYLAPPEAPDGTRVLSLRVSTIAPGTLYDTVLSVRNDCGPEYRDYSCNNDGVQDDGRDSRRSIVYYNDVEPQQYIYIIVDGFDGSAGQAEIVVDEIYEIGTRGMPCFSVPPSMSLDPTAAYAGYRCPNGGIRCRPGAAPDGTDLCLPLLALGVACDPEERRNVCEPFYLRQVLCAKNPMSRTEAICALPGTAPGALCRADGPGVVRCDGRLACSPSSGFNNTDVCVPLRSAGASCDPAPYGYTNHCEPMLVCCGDSPDAGASFMCREEGHQPCYPFVPVPW